MTDSAANEDAKIYRGEVVHKRIRPVEHRLNYRVFSLALDLGNLETLSKSLRLFSLNRFNLISLVEKDHGYRDNRSLSEFAWDQVDKANMRHRVEKIMILFYPRIFGFAFNPLTVYFCLGSDGLPQLMIYEVRNTFGENLTYVLEAGEEHNGVFSHQTPKQFYVSPFNKVEGDYTFHVTPPSKLLTVGVVLKIENQSTLRTHFRGIQTPLTDGTLLKAFVSYPLMTAKIVAGIHWEALKLWRKGLGLKERPVAPSNQIVFGEHYESTNEEPTKTH